MSAVTPIVSDQRIQHAIEAGEHNRSTAELVRNWCAHARIEKFGGIGIIEAQTGLPIGHHSVKCDHASEAGMAAWDLAEAALDFHDRNCIDCKLRKPVGFPNLSSLVQERDSHRTSEAEKRGRADAKEAEARNLRRAQRAALRGQLSSIATYIVDHIDEFDDQRTRECHDRICESARLAPERFEPKLVDYIFGLAEKEKWFADTGLTILQAITSNPKQLTRLALLSINYPPATRTASRILIDHVELIDSASIERILPAAVDLGNPRDDLFPFEHGPTAEPQLLLALWSSSREAVRKGLDQLFSSRKIFQVDLAARGVLALAESHPDAATPFARTMVSKFARARLLLDDFNDDDLYEGRQGLQSLLDAIVIAFTHDPEGVDAIIQDMIHGSDRKSRSRSFQIYCMALAHRHREQGEMIPATSQYHRIAFKRVLWGATTEDSETVSRTIQEVLRGQPYELEEIARAEIDALLGALLIFDDQLRKHDETPLPQNASFLERIENQSQRTSLIGLMKSTIDWASVAAKGDVQLAKKIAALFDTIPEDREDLRGLLLGSIEHLGSTVEGLKLVLPHLYSGLVGASVRVRAYAASALGEVWYRTQDNLPLLVYEAFSVLLWDQYVLVHKSAVAALHRLHLPESCRGRSAQALLHLIRYYAQKSGEDRFVVDCVSLLASELSRLGKENSQVAKYLVQVLLNADPLYVQSELRRFSYTLGKTEGFADLFLRHLPLLRTDYHRSDDITEILAELPTQAILAKRSDFQKVGIDLAPQKPWIAARVVEALTRAGAWAEARLVAQAGVDGCEPTKRNQSRRIFSRFIALATEFEESIAEGRFERLTPVVKQWSNNVKEQAEHQADVATRNSRTSFPTSL